jgi:type II secretory pathway component PulJ
MRSDAVDSDRPGGFILFEVMIAIAVFSIVALSLAMAMNSTIEASNYLDRQSAIRLGMDSMMNEALRKPKRQEMTFDYKDETLGVQYRTEMEEMRFTTEDGESLPGLYTLRARALYDEKGEERTETAERYVYRP